MLLRLLIVEDSEDDTFLLLRELQKGGYETDYCRVETSPDMERALTEKNWDLVISDHSMPCFSAPEALKVLRKSCPDLPFIIVTGAMGEEAAVEAMRAGAGDYIMKDNLSRLLPAVERELHDARTRRERKQAREALEESERRFRFIAENARDIIFRLQLFPGVVFEYLSPAIKNITGYEPIAFYHHPGLICKIVHPDDRYLLMKAVSDNYDTDTDTYTDTDTDTDTDIKAEKKTDAEADIEAEKKTDEDADIEAEKKADTEAEKKTDASAFADDVDDSKGHPFTARFYRKDGELIWLEYSLVPSFDHEQRITAVAGVVRDVTRRVKAEEVLKASREEIRQLSARILNAYEEERSRLSRDLHDEVGQVMSAVKLDLEMFEAGMEQELPAASPLRGRLKNSIFLLHDAIRNLRQLMLFLRPAPLHDMGLAEVVQDMLRELHNRTGIRTSLHTGEAARRLSPETETALYRCIQEGLTNVVRHSAAASVSVEIVFSENIHRVSIKDDGAGFDYHQYLQKKESLGLQGMQERINLLNGEFHIITAPGAGTEIILNVPA